MIGTTHFRYRYEAETTRSVNNGKDTSTTTESACTMYMEDKCPLRLSPGTATILSLEMFSTRTWPEP